MKTKILVAVLSILMFTGFTAAQKNTGDTVQELNPEKALDSKKLESSSVGTGILSALNFQLSFFTTGQTRFAPGEQGNFNWEVEATQTAQDAVFIFEINKCDPGIAINELTRDDCNQNIDAKRAGTVSVTEGENAYGAISYDMPSTEANYEVVAYLWKSSFSNDGLDNDNDGTTDEIDESLVSDSPNRFVVVEAEEDETTTTSDTDGDGIIDSEDDCVNEPGPRSNNGCPEPTNEDSDGDGIIDADDECPETPGVEANNGCPEDDSNKILFVVAAVGLALGAAVIATQVIN